MAVVTDPGSAPGRDAVVSLRAVTIETMESVLDLKVAPHQERFVSSVERSIAQAYFVPKAWFRAIYADETPMGFVQLHVDPEAGECHLWRFLIDQRYQGMGFGRQAMALVEAYVRTLPNAPIIDSSYVPGEGNPSEFYRSLGYVETGEVRHGEVIIIKRMADAETDTGQTSTAG